MKYLIYILLITLVEVTQLKATTASQHPIANTVDGQINFRDTYYWQVIPENELIVSNWQKDDVVQIIPLKESWNKKDSDSRYFYLLNTRSEEQVLAAPNVCDSAASGKCTWSKYEISQKIYNPIRNMYLFSLSDGSNFYRDWSYDLIEQEIISSWKAGDKIIVGISADRHFFTLINASRGFSYLNFSHH